MQQRWKWIVLAVLAALIVLRLWSGHSVVVQTAPSDAAGGPSQTGKESGAAAPVAKRVLVPDDPAKYGMVVVPADQHPQTAQDWEKIIRAGIAQNKVLDTPEARGTLEQVKTKPEEFEKNSKQLDTDIAKYEKELQEHPFDDTVKGHLDTLYKLRAVANILRDKVVSP